ncbi:hypothetical protein AAZX31_04G118300 [Glycine max]
MVLDILSRLPAKEIAMFKCVCKAWASVISHQDFSKDHERMFPSTEKVMILDSNPSIANILNPKEEMQDDNLDQVLPFLLGDLKSQVVVVVLYFYFSIVDQNLITTSCF